MTDNQPVAHLRTYRYHVAFVNVAAVVVVMAAALSFLWNRSAVNVLTGFALFIVAVMMIERMVHTTYSFTPDDMLVISRGRFARALTIPLNEVLSARAVTMKPLFIRVVMIEYGAGHVTSVRPDDCEGFVSELGKRQQRLTYKLLRECVQGE